MPPATPASSVAPSAPGSPRGGGSAAITRPGTAAATAAAAAAALADGSEPLPHAHVRACRLYLSEDERTLYVAWPDAIRVVHISAAAAAAGADGTGSSSGVLRRLSVASSFATTGFYCLGAVPHGKDKLAVLALPEEEEEEEEAQEAQEEDKEGWRRPSPPATTSQPRPLGRTASLAAAHHRAAAALVHSPGGSGYLEQYIKARGTGSDALASAAAALQQQQSAAGGRGGGASSSSSSRLGVPADAPSTSLSACGGDAEKQGEQQQKEQQQQAPGPPRGGPRRPELRLLARDGSAEYASDALDLRGWARCAPGDLALVPSYGNELALAGALTAAAAAAAATAEAFSSVAAAGGGGGTAAASSSAGDSAAASATAAAAARLARLQEESGAAGGEFMYFIMSPQDVVFGRFRDVEDRVAWLLERRRFEDALALAAANPGAVPAAVRDAAAAAFLEDLTSARGEWERAAAALPALLGDRPQLWERWLHAFASARKLRVLAPRVPTRAVAAVAGRGGGGAAAAAAATAAPLLTRAAYEMVLNALLADPEDHTTLLQLVQTWPNALYRPAALTDAVAARLRRAAETAAAAAAAGGGAGGDDDPTAPGSAAAAAAGGTRSLWQTLALLYKAQGRPDLSLAIYLQLRLPSVFDFLQQQHHEQQQEEGGSAAAAAAAAAAASSPSSGLLAFLDGPKAAALFEIDERRATDLLVRNMDAVPPAAVVPALLDAAKEALPGGGGDTNGKSGGGGDARAAATTTTATTATAWRRRAHDYLHRVFLADPSAAADFADLQLDLIAEFSPRTQLMPFLQQSQSYPLEKALEVCRRVAAASAAGGAGAAAAAAGAAASAPSNNNDGLVDEQVFLLSRMGNPRAALELIVERQRDVPRAIEFVRSQEQQQRLASQAAAAAAAAAHDDGDDDTSGPSSRSTAARSPALPPQQQDDGAAQLWDQLIAWAIAAGGETTGDLLDCLGGLLDPLVVVCRIPDDLKVPRLRDRLARVVADYLSGAGLLEGCATILRSDAARLVARLGREARRGASEVFVVVGRGGGGGGGAGDADASAAPPPPPTPPLLLRRFDGSGLPAAGAAAASADDLPCAEARDAAEAAAAQASAAAVAAGGARAGVVGGGIDTAAVSLASRARLAARGAVWVGLAAAAREADGEERR
jgi:hypothetical protein